MTHTHIASGLAGYGPDASDSDGFTTTHTVRETAEAIREKLSIWADNAYESAEALADAGQFEEAWTEHRRVGAMNVLRMNLDGIRAESPLYKSRDSEAWDTTLARLISENFPLDVSPNSRLYVWDCSETECETEQDS